MEVKVSKLEPLNCRIPGGTEMLLTPIKEFRHPLHPSSVFIIMARRICYPYYNNQVDDLCLYRFPTEKAFGDRDVILYDPEHRFSVIAYDSMPTYKRLERTIALYGSMP